jgi:cytochrome c
VIGAPFISSDVWVSIAALCALVSGVGMVTWVVALATQHSPTRGRPRWIILGVTVALAVAATGVWLFSQLQLASAAPLGVPLSASAQRGQQVFQLHCAACHNASTHAKYGPGLAGLFDPGGPTLPAGVDYGGKLPNGADITPDSVAGWLRSGGQGQIGIMPPAGMAMSEAEIADVIEFLKAVKK